MAAIKINVKWGKEKYPGVELSPTDTGLEIKARLYALTHVPPDRQKSTTRFQFNEYQTCRAMFLFAIEMFSILKL
jgi:hypothetical protein